MASTTLDRYTVGDQMCGLISSHARKLWAFREAQAAQNGPHKDCNVVVYDVMAMRGAAQLWGAMGNVLERRP